MGRKDYCVLWSIYMRQQYCPIYWREKYIVIASDVLEWIQNESISWWVIYLNQEYSSHHLSWIFVDFYGPFYIHHLVRGKPPTKMYIAMFVCFSVKDVHMELVSDLSTQSFIWVLKRFLATRGKWINISQYFISLINPSRKNRWNVFFRRHKVAFC